MCGVLGLTMFINFPFIMSILMFSVGLIFTWIVYINVKAESSAVELLAVFPVLAFVGAIIWFMSWHKFEYKEAMTKRGQKKLNDFR